MAWYDVNWNYRKLVTIDHNLVAGDESNFPVLVSVTDNDLRGTASSGHVANGTAGDILFTDVDGTTKIDHEIERYIGTSGNLIAWVEMPFLNSGTNTTFYMYYGNAGTTNQENPTGVWTSDFVGVWHLRESSGVRYDSTSNDNDLADNNTVTSAALKIGTAADFTEGNSEFLSRGNGSINGNFPGHVASNQMSFECWINIDNLPTDWELDGVMAKRNEGGDNVYEIVVYDTGPNTADNIQFGVMGDNVSLAPWSVSADTNYHILATFDHDLGTQVLYINGTAAAQANNVGTIGTNADSFTLGISSSSRYFDGLIDEARMSNLHRDANWVLTSYNTQNAPASFMSFGTEEANVVVSGTTFENYIEAGYIV